MRSGRSPCTASAGFLGMLWVGVFAAGYPTGINNVESSIGGQLMGMATFLPLGFLSGWVAVVAPQEGQPAARARARSSWRASTSSSTARSSIPRWA